MSDKSKNLLRAGFFFLIAFACITLQIAGLAHLSRRILVVAVGLCVILGITYVRQALRR